MKTILSLIIYLLAFTFSVPAFSATSTYIKLGDIKGESTDEAHEDWIEVESLQLGVDKKLKKNSLDAKKPKAGNLLLSLMVKKAADKSSANLLQYCAKGKHIDAVTLHVVQQTGDPRPIPYIVIEMKNVLITSISTSADNESTVPVESVTLNFSEVEYRYMPLPDATGNTKEAISWSLQANKKN